MTTWAGERILTRFQIPTFDWDGLGPEGMYIGMAQAASSYSFPERFGVTQEGRILYSDTAEDWVHVWDVETAEEILRFRLDLDAPPAGIVPNQDREWAARQSAKMKAGMDWWGANTWQAALAEGPEGETWVWRAFEPDDIGRWPVDVFDSRGRFRGRIAAPFMAGREVRHRDRIYAMTTGADEQPIIGIYRLERD